LLDVEERVQRQPMVYFTTSIHEGDDEAVAEQGVR
jgi:hypothetical protein